MAQVLVAMSGGVDSSVAAALLLEQGHEITGVTMHLEPTNREEQGDYRPEGAVADARRVCEMLGITHRTLDYRDAFEREVVEPFAAAYASGRTPNPCVVCNERVKFALLLSETERLSADFLATGHYARLLHDDCGEPLLARGLDSDKDQSYFLYRITREHMRRVLFPVGELHKDEVRAIAERFDLPVAGKAESQEACFAQDGDYAPIVYARHPEAAIAGEIVDRDGVVRGRHEGLAHYTVGQRKGLGIGGSAGPFYVVRLDSAANQVVVGRREDLRARSVTAIDVVWPGPPSVAQRLSAVVRYRMTPEPAVATLQADGTLQVTFDASIEGAAPGQSVVCYREDVVAGGGVIECAS